MPSEALTRNKTYGQLQAQMAKYTNTFAVAMPQQLGVNSAGQIARAQRAARCALTLIKNNQKILDCDPRSVLGSILQACQLGLELDGVLGEAYLIPYYNKDTKTYECQMQVGYRGLIALARRSGVVEDAWSTMVYKNEVYRVTGGDTPSIVHERILDDEARGEPYGVYATAYFVSGRLRHHPMTMGEVEKHRNASKAKRDRADNPWNQWFEEMVKKTPLRGLCKTLPQCPEAQRAAIHDEYVATGHAPPHQDIEQAPATVLEEVPPDEGKVA
jgi:recombination protein RecT